ncbi:MAG: DUF2066 domain-containing protein [Steroidobacteraceae bacterium]
MTPNPDFDRAPAGRAWLATIAWLLLATPGLAQSQGDLYSATVPYAGQNEAAFREAMRSILVRVTGKRDAAELENLAPLVAEASRYVVSYRRAAGNQLTVTFDGTAIENAIDASGLPFWSGDRPLTLVWLAYDRGDGRRALVSADEASEWKTRIDQSAERRGLPLVWPGSGDDLTRALQQAWSGDHAPLVGAAKRYGADGVLIGKARVTAGDAVSVEWNFSAAGLAGSGSGDLEAGPELAADRYASVHASRSAGQRTEQLVTVTGIGTLEAYAAAMRTLSRLAPVRGVAVDEVTPDAVSFLVNVRGDPDALREAILRDGRLQAVDDGRLIYSMSP